MVYLHVPFCRSFCTYCGFYSVVSDDYEAYAEAVLGEIEARRGEIEASSAVNTLYIGGGTPSVLPVDVLSRIVSALSSIGTSCELPQSHRSDSECADAASDSSDASLRSAPPFASLMVPPLTVPRVAWSSPVGAASACQSFDGNGIWSEFTMEVNPEDVVERGEEYVRGLMELGVNRVSMGVQSFDDGILRWMNRRHNAARAEEAYRILRRCGIRNISIDLIFGIPGLDDETWAHTIAKALKLAPEHISAYQLSIEEGSTLADKLEQGIFKEASDEVCRHQYDMLCEALRKAGYRHYEISNFARPGYEAVHNSAYWHRVPYVGLGPGAHSLSGTSKRSWNTCVIPRRNKAGELVTYSREEEILSPEDIRVERIMLPLRTDEGLPEEELRALAAPEIVDALIAERALVVVDEMPAPDQVGGDVVVAGHDVEGTGRIRIPEDHFFVSDEIIRELV